MSTRTRTARRATPAAQDRRLRVQTPLGKDVLAVNRLSVIDELGRPFQIDADLESRDHSLDLDRLLGAPMLFEVALGDGKRRHFHGLVASCEQEDGEGDLAHYRVRVVPWLWMLTRTADCRIFQDKSVPEILKSIFKEYGYSDVKDSLRRSYKPWTYCVQYRESDFNFVSRLMEHEGIYYFWRYSADKHEMVLVDDPTSHSVCPGCEGVRYGGRSEGYSGAGRILSWRLRQKLQPGIFALNDFNPGKPSASLLAKSALSRQRAGKRWEVFDYPGDYVEHADGERYARLRMEELQAEHETFIATTDVVTVGAGYQFGMRHHPRRDQNRKYLITHCRLEFGEEHYDSASEGAAPMPFHGLLTSMDANQSFRPPRTTPKPVVQGPQTAIVVGTKGEEIYVDDEGRVKVQFHWDRYGKKDQDSSCWIRVSHPWAGKGFGGMAVPRIGQEVIVEFLEGDPDRPIINGRVYNSDSLPNASNAGQDGRPGKVKPTGMRQAAMMTSLKSNSLGGSGGSNEITMNDSAGDETLLIKAQKDEVHTVGNDREDSVGNDEKRKVGNNRTREVGVNEEVKIGVKRTENVGADQATTIGVGEVHSVGVSRMKKVGVVETAVTGMLQSEMTGLMRLEAVGFLRAEVTGMKRMVITGGDHSLKVGGDLSETVSGGLCCQVGKDLVDKAGGSWLASAGANAGIKAAGMVVIEAPDITLKAGGGFIRIDASGVTIQGTLIKLNSGGAPGNLPDPAAPAGPAGGGSSGPGGGSGGTGPGGAGGSGTGAGAPGAGGAAGTGGTAGAGGGCFGPPPPLAEVLQKMGIPPHTSDLLGKVLTDPGAVTLGDVGEALPSASDLLKHVPDKYLPESAKKALATAAKVATGTPAEAEQGMKDLAKQAKEEAKKAAEKEIKKRLEKDEKKKKKDDAPKDGVQPGKPPSGGSPGSGGKPATP